MFHYPQPSLGATDPLASYRAAQEARRGAQAPGPAGMAPPPQLAPLILAPPTQTPRWAIWGGVALGITVLALAGMTIWRRK